MTIVTKAEALRIQKKNPGSIRYAFCGGKYKHAPTSHYLGKEVPDLKGTHAVYAEQRSDRDGKYMKIMCITTPH